jgi:hypothetical protein
MGNSLFADMTCPCRPEQNTQIHPHGTSYEPIYMSKKFPGGDIVETLLIGKLNPKNILFEYAYGFSKLYLIDCGRLEEFCNTRSLFKFTLIKSENKIEDFYDSIYVTNFLAKSGICLIYLTKSISISIETEKRPKEKMKKFRAVSGMYKIDTLNYNKCDLEEIVDIIKKRINYHVMRNQKLLNIINTEEESFKLVFQRNMKENSDYRYELHVMEGILEEGNIKSVLIETKYKKLLLKTVLVLKISRVNRKYILVFEENSKEENEYDYLILSLEKGKLSNDIFLKDFVHKMNDLDKQYELACIVSDETKLLIVLYTSILVYSQSYK